MVLYTMLKIGRHKDGLLTYTHLVSVGVWAIVCMVVSL